MEVITECLSVPSSQVASSAMLALPAHCSQPLCPVPPSQMSASFCPSTSTPSAFLIHIGSCQFPPSASSFLGSLQSASFQRTKWLVQGHTAIPSWAQVSGLLLHGGGGFTQRRRDLLFFEITINVTCSIYAFLSFRILSS